MLSSEGSFSNTYLAECKASDQTQMYVIKRRKDENLSKGARRKDMEEVFLLHKVQGHQNVVKLVRAWEAGKVVHIAMKFCEGGT